MGQYRVTVTYRSQATFDVDAADEQAAEDQALGLFEESPAVEADQRHEVLSVKARPRPDGEAVRPKAERPSRAERTVTAEPVVIEAEATTVSETVLPDLAPFPPPVKRKGSLGAYVWTAFWIAVLVVLARLGSQ